MRYCIRCEKQKSPIKFISVKSPLLNGVFPICRECVKQMFLDLQNEDEVWNLGNKLCQMADVPFVPEVFQQVYKENGTDCFGNYCYMFSDREYNTYDWGTYNDIYLQLELQGRMGSTCPTIDAEEKKQLIRKWGKTYKEDEIEYLENLYQGIVNSTSIVGGLNEDQVLKVCKISLIIEDKIKAGVDVSKDLKAYDDLCKLAGVSSEKLKEGNEFNSTGEVFAYLEKQGYKVKYYDGTIQDEVDKTIKDIQYWQRYMYVNETGIADEIQERINGLKNSDQIIGENFDWKGFEKFSEGEGQGDQNEEFEIEI